MQVYWAQHRCWSYRKVRRGPWASQIFLSLLPKWVNVLEAIGKISLISSKTSTLRYKMEFNISRPHPWVQETSNLSSMISCKKQKADPTNLDLYPIPRSSRIFKRWFVYQRHLRVKPWYGKLAVVKPNNPRLWYQLLNLKTLVFVIIKNHEIFQHSSYFLWWHPRKARSGVGPGLVGPKFNPVGPGHNPGQTRLDLFIFKTNIKNIKIILK